MRDLIDRDELIDMLKSAIAIKKPLAIRIGADNDPVIQMEIKTYTDILNRVNKMSPAEQERKAGRWIDTKVIHKDETSEIIEEWQSAKCTVCGKYHTTPYLYYFDYYNFCPNCGAKMTKEENK